MGGLRLVDKWRRLGGTTIVNTIPGDCTVGFQAAINACNPGDTLYVPAGVYTVSAPAPGTAAILSLPFGIKIEGDGVGETIIKVADACPTYEYILGPDPWTLSMTGLEIHDITFDHNIANNAIEVEAWDGSRTYETGESCSSGGLFYECVVASSTNHVPPHADWSAVTQTVAREDTILSWPEETIGVFATSNNVNIHDIEIVNASSVNNIVLHTGTGHHIENITGSNLGDDPNHVAHDASFIYEDTNECLVDNVNISAVIGGLGQTCGVEMHGEDYTVQNCTVADFRIGMNLAGIAPWTCGGLVTQNTITGCSTGIYLWSLEFGAHTTGYGIDGLTISNNDITLCYTNLATDSPMGIAFYPSWAHSTTIPLDVNDLHITDNNVTAPLEAIAGAYSDEGCGIGRVSLNEDLPLPVLSNSSITGNVITNIPLPGIRFGCDLEDVTVTGNTLINCGSSLKVMDAPRHSYIFVDGNVDTLGISSDTFIDNIPVTRINNFLNLWARASSTGFTISGNSYTITGDKVALARQITVGDNIIEPLITETILGFVVPTHKVNTASEVSYIVVAAEYRITPVAATRAPKDWTLQGSQNNADWTTLDTRTDEVFSADTMRAFSFTDTIPYRYYKLDVTENGGSGTCISIKELMLVHVGGSLWTVDGTGLVWTETPDDATPIMTSDVLPAPNVTTASTVEAGYEAYKAFDRTTAYWRTSTGNVTGWLKIDLGA